MNYGQTRVYGVSLSYLMANGDRSFSYYEIPAESDNEAMDFVRQGFYREHPLASYKPDVSAKLLYTDYWSYLRF